MMSRGLSFMPPLPPEAGDGWGGGERSEDWTG